MKKTIYFIGFFTSITSVFFLNGCSKEKPLENEISVFDDEVKRLEIELTELSNKIISKYGEHSIDIKGNNPEIKTQITPENPNNPNDFIGTRHTDFLDYVASKIDEIKSPICFLADVNPPNPKEPCYTKSEKIAGVVLEADAVLYGNKGVLTISQLANISEIVKNNINENSPALTLNKFLNSGFITNSERVILNVYSNVVKHIEDVNLFILISNEFENAILSSSLEQNQKGKILSFITTAKYSMFYWEKQFQGNGQWSSEDLVPGIAKWKIALADAAGAVLGWFSGGIAASNNPNIDPNSAPYIGATTAGATASALVATGG